MSQSGLPCSDGIDLLCAVLCDVCVCTIALCRVVQSTAAIVAAMWPINANTPIEMRSLDQLNDCQITIVILICNILKINWTCIKANEKEIAFKHRIDRNQSRKF